MQHWRYPALLQCVRSACGETNWRKFGCVCLESISRERVLQVWLAAIGLSLWGEREARLSAGGKKEKKKTNQKHDLEFATGCFSNPPESAGHRHVLSAGGCGSQPCKDSCAKNVLCCPWADGCACRVSCPPLPQEVQQVCGRLQAQMGICHTVPSAASLERKNGRRFSVPHPSGAQRGLRSCK